MDASSEVERPESSAEDVESPAEDVLPVAAEEIQPAKDNDGALLLLHH